MLSTDSRPSPATASSARLRLLNVAGCTGAAALACLLGGPAHAAWPEDVEVSSMLEHDGEAVDPALAREQLDAIATELGVSMANKPFAPARTLGVAGFDVTASVTVALASRSDTTDDGAPSGWALSHTDGDPGALTALPTLELRKGLPASTEVGARASWLAGSRQGVLGGFVRVAPVEGFPPWPDVSFQVGYSGYLGNPELRLGALDATGSLGGTFAFGSYPGIRQAQFSPWIGGGVVVLHGRTTLDAADRTALYQDAVDEDGTYSESLSLGVHPQIHGGFQVTNSTVLFRVAAAWSPSTAPTLRAGMGFMF